MATSPMATSPTERQEILADIATLGIRDLVQLWRRASQTDTDFAALISAAVPEIASGYASMAADFAADWYIESAPDLPYTPITAPSPDVAKLTQSTQWALGAHGDKALNRMAGTMQRTVFNGARDTTLINVEKEQTRWVRRAQPDACAFCKLLAIRTERLYHGHGVVFDAERNVHKTVVVGRGGRPRGSRNLGEDYHDHCQCVAVEIRVPSNYSLPPEAQEWDTVHSKAVAEAGSAGNITKILAAWRQLDGSR